MIESIGNSRRRSSVADRAVRAAVTLIASLAVVAAFAEGAPREGVDYTVVKPAQPTDAAAGKVEVIEFFGYWCHFCSAFEPTMSDWARRNDPRISTLYVPVSFAPAQAALQNMYYAFDALGKEKELRRKIFAAIHDDKSLSPSADVATMAAWAEKNGVDKQKFIDTLNSFSVQARVNRANQIATAYGVTGVPTLAIGGKYLLSVQASTIGNADVLLGRAIGEK